MKIDIKKKGKIKPLVLASWQDDHMLAQMDHESKVK